MSPRIDETLKKIAGGIPSGETDTGEIKKKTIRHSTSDLPGDPECPLCGGVGYLREDLPVGHPNFGRAIVCSCRNQEISQQVRSQLFAMSNLEELSHLTFETFQPRGRIGLVGGPADSLERAYNQARNFASTLNGWLLLIGGYGCGKTHLAAAVANFAVEVGVPTLFLTVPDLLDSLRFSYQDPNSSFESRFEEIRTMPLLILDDFGTQNATPWAQEKLFQILNYRYINRKPLVVTTNLGLEEIEGRISSRLEDPSLVTKVQIQAPDYRNPIGASRYHPLSSLDLVHDMTFASFNLRKEENLKPEDRKSLEAAFQAAHLFAEKPHGWIVFTGGYGSGKTHLAAAIGNFRAELGEEVIFIVVPDLLDELRATFSPNSPIPMSRHFDLLRTCPLLILDDLGTQSSTPWAREKLYQLFNHRYMSRLPTVITTSSFKEEMDARLLSRMEDTRLSTIYPIMAPSFRGSPQKTTRGTRKSR